MKLNNIRPTFSYSLTPIILISILVILNIIILLIINKKPKAIKLDIKSKYLLKLKLLESKIIKKTISNKEAYKNLSLIIRNYYYDYKNIKIQNYTLNDIKALNLFELTKLIEECYENEFNSISKGNIIKSLEKARSMIKNDN